MKWGASVVFADRSFLNFLEFSHIVFIHTIK